MTPRLLAPVHRLLGVASWARHTLTGASRAAKGARQTVIAVPDLVRSILVLPTILERLNHICRNTDALPPMLANLERVAADASELPDLHRELVRMNATVAQMRGDTGTIATHMPTLVVLEKSLPAMVPVLEDLDRALQRLAEIAEPLQGAALRVGRFADRLPYRTGR